MVYVLYARQSARHKWAVQTTSDNRTRCEYIQRIMQGWALPWQFTIRAFDQGADYPDNVKHLPPEGSK